MTKDTSGVHLLAGKTALVTGAAQGIGLAHARVLSGAGARVAIADLDATACEAAVATIPGGCFSLPMDVSDPVSVDEGFVTLEAEFGHLDILVNNAALMVQGDRPFQPFWEIEPEIWDRVFAVNTRGPFLCARAAKPLMESIGGSIINIISDAIWAAYEGQLAYFASKGALDTMTRCLARELGPFGIRVNGVAPGLTLSDSVRGSNFLMGLSDEIANARALRRTQQPNDVADVVLLLASDLTRAVSGHVVVVNSGGHMR
jgi:NAD(P)-dependent dehydrogenase (short-subunit alcohol dehydrogenase family)